MKFVFDILKLDICVLPKKIYYCVSGNDVTIGDHRSQNSGPDVP